MLIGIDNKKDLDLDGKKAYIYDKASIDELLEIPCSCYYYENAPKVDINLSKYDIRCRKTAKREDKDLYDIPYKENRYAIIVPNYNNSKWIRKCIDSILNQTYKNFELIIIDGYEMAVIGAEMLYEDGVHYKTTNH